MILVDRPIYRFKERLWCHMVSDRDLAELHAFAQSLGVPRYAFQDHAHRNHPHYDIPAELHVVALERGAELVTGRELVTRMVRPGRVRGVGRGELLETEL